MKQNSREVAGWSGMALVVWWQRVEMVYGSGAAAEGAGRRREAARKRKE